MSLLTTIRKNMMLAKFEPEGKKLSLLLATLYGEASAVGKNNGNRQSTDEEVIKVITKFVKNNNETIKILKKAGKEFSSQESENVILESYLPKQLSEGELVAAISCIIGDLGASSPKDMGKVMKELKSQHGGLYDGKVASTIVREQLQ